MVTKRRLARFGRAGAAGHGPARDWGSNDSNRDSYWPPIR